MYEQLKKDSIQARKDRSPNASALNTLLSEVTMRAKNDGNMKGRKVLISIPKGMENAAIKKMSDNEVASASQ